MRATKLGVADTSASGNRQRIVRNVSHNGADVAYTGAWAIPEIGLLQVRVAPLILQRLSPNEVWSQMDFVSLRCADAAERQKLKPVDNSEVQRLKVPLNTTTAFSR